jgi:long-chain acyl-CoA synthetase
MTNRVRFKGSSLPEAFYHHTQSSSERALFATRRAGAWRDFSSGQALDFVLRTMAGLKRLGFQRGDVACIFSDNREEWILTDYAIQWLGGLTTAIYTTSSKASIQYILEQSQTRFIFVSNQDLLNRLGDLESIRSLKAIIHWDPIHEWDQKILHVDRGDFLKEKLEEKEAVALLPQIRSEDPAILLYTSGTTGEPKGVLLSQGNVISNIRQMHQAFPLEDLSRTMSFLPLSHIYERSLHSTLLLAGIKASGESGRSETRCDDWSATSFREDVSKDSRKIEIGSNYKKSHGESRISNRSSHSALSGQRSIDSLAIGIS